MDQRQEIEFRIISPDTGIRWLRSNFLSIAEPPDKHVLTGIAEDFTARKESYDVLEKFAAKKILFWRYFPMTWPARSITLMVSPACWQTT